MSSISSSAYYSVSGSNASSSGISGMMSGMDTDQMVEELLAGTQAKIDAQEGLKMQSEWKQEIYYDVISSINSFRNKYFDLTFDSSSELNFGNSDFFNTMISNVSSGSAVDIIGSTSDAATGDFKVKVTQLAENAKIKDEAFSVLGGNNTITSSSLTEESITELYNKNVVLKVGSTEVAVNLDDVKTEDDLVETIQKALTDKGISDVEVSINNNALKFTGRTDISVDSDKSGKLGLEISGLSSISSGEDFSSGTTMDFSANPSFDLNLNGVNKTISLNQVKDSDGDGTYTIDDLHTAVSQQVKNAFGDYISVGIDGDKLTFSITNTSEQGHDITITGSETQAAIGVKPGATTKFDLNQTLSELGTGNSFSFTINGEDFEFSGDTTVSKLISEVNSSGAGITISYSSISDKMSISSDNSGEGFGINIQQNEGDILTKLFGSGVVENAGKFTSDALTVKNVGGTGLAADFETTEASMTFTVNGKSHTFSLEANEETPYTKADVETKLNEWLSTTFGETGGTQNIEYNAATGNLVSNDGSQISFAKSSADISSDELFKEAAKSDLALAFGFNVSTDASGNKSSVEKSNVATATTNISDIAQLQGMEGVFTKADGSAAVTLQDIAKGSSDGVSVDVSFENGSLVYSNLSGDISSSNKLSNLFGNQELTAGSGGLVAGVVDEGQDAVFSVNGVETSRSDNTFTIDGITMKLTSVSEVVDGKVEETVISTERNTDKIIEGFKSFVEDYNSMIEKLNGYVTQDADYRDYAPLSDAQKNEMTEREIELWEEKAKTGLVRNDTDIQSFLSQMRTAIYSTPIGSDLALFQIGIETTSDYTDGGKLQLDETALREALAKDPEGVAELFTGSSSALSNTMVDILDGAAKTSAGDPGSLVQLAGAKGSSLEDDNEIARQLADIEDRITALKEKYELEKERYWSDFNTMEAILANYSSQSSYISQQFSAY